MAEQASADKFRSIKAFREFEQRTYAQRSLGVEPVAPAPPVTDEVSTLRVLAAVKRRGDGVRRSELAQELHATPEAVEAAVLRLLKEGLVTLKAGSGPDDVLIAA